MVIIQKIIYLKQRLSICQSIGTHWIALYMNGNSRKASYDAICL